MSYWPNTQDFKLLPICRAIVVILDELSPEKDLEPDGLIHLDDEMERQSVLLVLTGDDFGLSTPITFESLRAQSLPLARTDYNSSSDGTDAIRVSLALAVRFIAALERREEATFRESKSNTIDGSLCPTAVFNGPVIRSADEWANEIIKQAAEKGKENVYETRNAFRRIQAVQRGEEDRYESELPPFNARWI